MIRSHDLGLFLVPIVGFLATTGFGGGVSVASAQEPVPTRIRVFIDCEPCDLAHLRQEIRFVDWVRDQGDADVSVLITSGKTGGAGKRFDLQYEGRGAFEDVDESLRYTSSATDTPVEVRGGLKRTLQAGLLRYAARTPSLQQIEISYDPGTPAGIAPSPDDDPWKRWVFRTGVSGSFQAEDRSEFVALSGNQRISRVTEGMKFTLEVGGTYSESNFETSDSTTVTSLTRNYEAELLYVASLGSHWGIGFRGSATHSTFRNYDLALRFAPAIEVNLFPYEESTRRQFRILYAAGPRRFDYEEETVFFETEETRVEQILSISLDVKEPWGSAILALEGSSFFDEIERNRIKGYGFLRVRLVKGFGVFFEASAARVRDQINLPRGDATDAEVLLRQRELRTDFRAEGRVGFDITFGSIYSGAVNPRFGG